MQTASVQQLEARLNEYKNSLKQLEMQYSADFGIVNRLIGKLSHACRGQNRELDNKLGLLRTKLNQNQDLNNCKQLLEQIEQLLARNAAVTETNLKKLDEEFSEAGKQLQQLKGLDPSLRRDLRELLVETDPAELTVFDYLPKLGALLRMYQTTLCRFQSELSTPIQGAESRQEHSQPLAHLLELLTEAIEGLKHQNRLPDGPIVEAFERLLASFGRPLQVEPVAQACIELVKLLLDQLQQEQDATQDFLKALNSQLNAIAHGVTSTLVEQRALNSDRHELSRDMQQNLDDIQRDLDNTHSIEALRIQVRNNVEALLLANSKQQDLNARELALLSQLEQANTRITALEQTAQNYRHQLDHQKQQALTDALTQLPNRAAFDSRLEQAFHDWQHQQQTLVLAVLDIDHFKQINDSFGHAVGDKTLQVIAKVVKKCLRNTDFIARYGGEEFVLLLNMPLDHSRIVFEKIRQRVEKLPFEFKGQRVTITVSMGATQFRPDDDPASAFERADKLLYTAKNGGRNQVKTDE